MNIDASECTRQIGSPGGEPALALGAPDPLRGDCCPSGPATLLRREPARLRRTGAEITSPVSRGGGRPRELDRSNEIALACPGASNSTIHGASRPSRPPGRPRRPGHQPAVVVAPRDAGRLPGRRRRRVGVHRRTTRSGCWARSPRRGWRSWPRTSASCGCSSWPRPTSTSTSPATAGSSARPVRRGADVDRLLLPGVRHHRRAAAVLRRARHPGRRPPEDRQRPRHPDRRRRAALQDAATSGSRSPARAGSRRPTRCSTPTGCRSRCSARPTARAAKVTIDVPGDAPLVARILVAHVGRVPLLLLDSDVEENPEPLREVTDRLYGGSDRAPTAPGAAARCRRRARAASALPDHRRPGSRGVPHQRGPRRLPRPRADPRALRGRRRPAPGLRHRARGLPRRHGVHDAHPGAGGHRPVPARPDRAVLRQPAARCPACRSTGSWRSAPRTSRAATPASSTWP